MSSCISGGGRTYGFDLEILKSPSTSSSIRTPHSSSPSSTLSESSNSPITISTRKPRTPRKRPNQTYNEAAALLSTAYPNIFSPQHLTKSCKFTKPQIPFFDESSELLLPFRATGDPGFLLHRPILEKPSLRIEPPTVLLDSCEKSQSQENSSMPYDEYYGEDFDADSILDEEMGEGIDSIMGNLSVNKSSTDEIEHSAHCYNNEIDAWNFSRNFESVFGITRGMGALRRVDHEGDLWRFPTVDILQISPKFNKAAPPTTEKKKKKKKIEKPTELKLPKEESSILKLKSPESPEEISLSKPDSNTSLLLKLNYEEVLNAWSDRGSAFSDETPGSEFPGMDVSVRSPSPARDLNPKKISNF